MTHHIVSAAEVEAAAKSLSGKLRALYPQRLKLYGIPRGGVTAAYALRAYDPQFTISSSISECDLLIDDLIDSGETAKRWHQQYGRPVAVLFQKGSHVNTIFGKSLPEKRYAIFPWEGTPEQSAEDIPRRLLQYIGENPDREGLLETPHRFLKAWREWTAGYAQDAASVLKAFKDGADGVNQLVIVRDIPTYSMCEHHLAPFFGTTSIGYIPEGKIVGLSKLSRIVDVFARRLQVQERCTEQIADAIWTNLKPKGVGVVMRCRHTCMESRGVERQGSETITSALRGCLLTEDAARAEFFNLTENRR